VVHVALFEPEIAGNAGSAARSCLATGASLHLIRPLGFRLTGEAIRRAGMDYWHDARVEVHPGFADFYARFAPSFEAGRVFAFSTKAATLYSEALYQEGDVLLFGPESRGLPERIRELGQGVHIPMRAPVRSLNLAVSVGIALYECRRQLGS
jgi:tRNA (cytidine/uridine-2'-O-)-methyltransferase